jgi:hypothetical protein
MDRFHLVIDVIDRLPEVGDKGVYLKQELEDKLLEHRQYINKNGQDLPEIRNWKWGRRYERASDKAAATGNRGWPRDCFRTRHGATHSCPPTQRRPEYSNKEPLSERSPTSSAGARTRTLASQRSASKFGRKSRASRSGSERAIRQREGPRAREVAFENVRTAQGVSAWWSWK